MQAHADPTTKSYICQQLTRQAASRSPTRNRYFRYFWPLIPIASAILSGCDQTQNRINDLARQVSEASNEIAQLKAEKAEAIKARIKADGEIDRLRAVVARFSIDGATEELDHHVYTLDDGIQACARVIIATVSSNLTEQRPKDISVEPITLDGRTRVTDEAARVWDPSPSLPLHESFDLLGRQIERLLEQRLTEHNAILVLPKARTIIRGSYSPDTPKTFKLFLRIFSDHDKSGFSHSCTATISKQGLSPNYLDFINQLDFSEREEKPI